MSDKCENKEVLISVRDLQKHFPVKDFFGRERYSVKAVDHVSFDIYKGETFGLVGESGCGKSTLGRTMIRMYNVTGGEISYEGQDITKLKGKDLLPYHRKMQIIFQDPYSSLDPTKSVRELIAEPMKLQKKMSKQERDAYIISLLKQVGLNEDDLEKYASEFSGGQRQRIGIARALSVQPEFIMCDEPISALDVSIQAQVVNLLEDLQKEHGLTYLFVAHDLSMVRHISHRIGVMYLGQMVEISESEELYENPLHPYTKVLLSAIPVADPETARKNKRIAVEGEIASPMDQITGCRFASRCPNATPICSQQEPQLKEVKPGHSVACHLY